jgi:uncharacterized UPF0160 family protein
MENDNVVKVCVHDGMFHADEVVALAIIMIALGKDNVEYIRSRNYPDFMEADFAVDVGGKYDGVRFFDHHQNDFFKMHEGTDIKYAAAGLVWDIFCPTIAVKYLGDTDINRINKFYTYVVNNLILGIDAVDNGQYRDNNSIHQNTLSSIVKTFNVDNYIANWEKQNIAFKHVTEFIYQYLDRFFENTANSILDEDIVLNAYAVSDSGIMVLPKFIPSWKNIMLRVDANHKVKVCLVEAKPGEWSITSALKEANSMEPLCPAPLFLRGVTDADNVEVENSRFIFVHKSGYTGSFKASSKDNAIKVAKKWVELSNK